MDKEKLKKAAKNVGRYTGYAGLGLVGGLFCMIFIFKEVYFKGIPIQFPILWVGGGLLGGVIAKKWWGALVGGFILNGLIWLLALLAA